MGIRDISKSLLGSTLLALTLGSPPAFAQKTTLKIADAFGTNHYMNKVVNYFISEVKKQDPSVDFQYFPGEQLGKAKDLLSLTRAGVVDIGYIAPAFVTDKMPLSTVAELPLAFSKACPATEAFVKLAHPEGILGRTEYAGNQVRFVFALILPPYQMFTRTKDFSQLDAVRGLKIRTSGPAKSLALQAIGAVPVQISTPDIYEALSRGTVDGLLLPMGSVALYDLTSHLKFGTTNQNFGSFVVSYAINESRWNSLSPDAQKAIVSAGDATSRFACKLSQADEDVAAAQLEKAGIKPAVFDSADRKRLTDALDHVAQDWAANLDKAGKPGTQVLNAFTAELKSN